MNETLLVRKKALRFGARETDEPEIIVILRNINYIEQRNDRDHGSYSLIVFKDGSNIKVQTRAKEIQQAIEKMDENNQWN